MQTQEEKSFLEQVDAWHEDTVRSFNDTLNIVVIGNVSSGKSSLINAILGRDRNNMIASVGATSGTSSGIQAINLDERVRIVDSPGLYDIESKRSNITKDFLRFVDVGILVISGPADSVQRKHVQDLQHKVVRSFVVLNKIDQWDELDPRALSDVEAQWKRALGIGTIYKTCCKGYDPYFDPNKPLDLRGIEDLRKDIWIFLAHRGKNLLLSRHLYNKEHNAVQIIASSLVVVAAGCLSPGAPVIVATTQLGAIYSLHYLYTGKFLTKSGAINVILSVGTQQLGTQLFLLINSLLPTSGLSSYAVVVYTFTLLAAYTKILARGDEVVTNEKLIAEFQSTKKELKIVISESSAKDWRNKDFWGEIIEKMLYSS